MELKIKAGDTEIYEAVHVFSETNETGMEFINIIDLCQEAGYDPDWLTAWEVDGKPEDNYEIVLYPRSKVCAYGMDYNGKRFVSVDIQIK